MTSFEELKPEYQSLFGSCKIRSERVDAANRIVDRILKNESRYRITQAKTGVPWSVIALIHSLESDLNFSTHLHNGDPLTHKTTHEPIGRPPGNPPFTWEDSATDALQSHGLTIWQDWSIPGVLFRLEKFNGMGYRNPNISIPTPYLWSFSNHYSEGKFVGDGRFDANAVSQQCGAAVLLKIMLEREVETNLDKSPTGQIETMNPIYPQRIIKVGEDDVAVVRPLQLRLNELGCGPLQGTGFFGQKTDAAVKLFQARFPDPQGQPLVIDGEVGPLTWGALFGSDTIPPSHPSSNLLIKVMEIAASQIGVREKPLGSNSGPEVDEYLHSVGLDPGPNSFWCVAFEYWCFKKAAAALGRNNPMIKTAGVLDHWHQAGRSGISRITTQQAQNNPSLLKAGMIFTIDIGDGFGHSGLVENVVGGRLVTIEGNTNTDGSRNGIGVFRRDARKLKDINVGFIDYSNL